MAGEQVVVEKLAAGGDGISHLADGRVVFVAGGLPGERVDIAITTMKRDFARADVVQILEPSPFRQVEPCPMVGNGCGGCGWQHIHHDGQLVWKADIVRDALRRTAKLPNAVVELGGSVPPWAYRTSMRVAIGEDGRVGLKSPRSHRVVALDDCMVAHPRLAALLPALRARRADEISLRVGVSSGERSAWSEQSTAEVRGLPTDVLTGARAVIHERIAGVDLQVSAASFFQSGPAAAELLVSAVRTAGGDLLDEEGVIDAYGGIGLFSATLGLRRPVVVEGSSAACADARVNLAGAAATVECSAVEDWEPEPAPLVIADPSRSGLGAAAASVLAATNAERIVLVSCDPVSLARDARLLAEQGYEHRNSVVLDLFPQTVHVEVVTVFERTDNVW